MAKGMEQVPAKPFADWLQTRFAEWSTRSAEDPARALSKELGWPGDAGVRRLFRYRRQQRGTSGSTPSGERWKADIHTDTFPRVAVEDALHMAGVEFDSLYVSYAERLEGHRAPARNVLTFIATFELIAEEIVAPVEVVSAWCLRCQEETLRDSRGDCQWCAGEREFRMALEREAENRRRYEREKKRRYAAVKRAA